jgi:hypothetical protein
MSARTEASTTGGPGASSPARPGGTAVATLNRLRLRLWDCRISLISVLLGLVVLILIPPVQDLLLEIRSLPSIVGFAVIVLVFWTLPVHNAASRAIEAVHRPAAPGRERAARTVDALVPRGLGGATLLVIFLAAGSAARSLGEAHDVPEIDEALHVLHAVQICMLAAVPVYAAYVVWRRHVLASPRTSFLFSLFRAMPAAIGVFTFLVLAVAIVTPSEFVWQVGREDLVPLLLGGWVPAFSYLALLSHRTGWPITLLTLVALFVVAGLSDSFHDVRTFQSAEWHAIHENRPGAPERQSFIDTAIDGWMSANGCLGAAHECPPVILIAAEGGGSRAAFYTGTILGALLDATRAYPDYYRDFGQTIFAMSGVSGGALGITLARTALIDAGTVSAPPCRYVEGDIAALRHRDPTKSWRACLQLLASGDYLSPTILGAIFRDTLALIVSAVAGVDVDDRAALLEEAIEQHYNEVVSGERTPCGDDEDRRGLCRPFGYLPAPAPGRWQPLLLLNATSVDSGRQIIVSDLYIGAESPAPGRCTEPYPHSYSVFEVLASGGPPPTAPSPGCLAPGLRDAEDLRLSTAAVMSARFPVVSPKGNLRNRDGIVIEQVVDGSFFDNTGLESLAPLIPMLQAHGLRPLVIHIANKPWELRRPGSFMVPGRPLDRDDPHHVRIGNVDRTSWADALETISSPLLALNSARSGHVERAEEDMMRLVAAEPSGLYLTPRLYPAPALSTNEESEVCEDEPSLGFSLRNLSMSWWLSPLVRRLIDAQLCDKRDEHLLADVLAELELDPQPK